MRHIYLSGVALCLFLPVAVSAQEEQHTFQLAEAAYEMGRFARADSLLRSSVESLKAENQISAYRMLALIALQEDRQEEAEEHVSRLLAIDPFYTAYSDSPRFADMVERMKRGKTTITTASKMAESVEEAPVPVTLITEEMIRASGATKLSDVLMLYVPGLSAIGSIEDNVAVRGVYGLIQETMLVMVDGHRINSQSTNAEPLDFRNSLEKIKQIEVLRGPASSLYGNVALTAVVNIITKSGSQLEGGEVQFRGGSYNSYGGDLLLGNGNLQSDYLVWSSLYTSEGEKRTLGGTTHYNGAYNHKPAYDFGGKVRWGDFNVHALLQHANVVPYYNMINIGEAFSYDKYGRMNGEKPGSSRMNDRLDADYSHTWGNYTLSASAFVSHERVQIYNVLSDTVPYMIAVALAKQLGLSSVRTQGVFQAINWEDYSMGGSLSGTYDYRWPGQMHGSLLFGLQYENYLLTEGALKLGSDFVKTNTMLNDILQKGNEHIYSGFLQEKHVFSKQLIFNGGLRFDHKVRFDGRRLNTLSPRLSLIWKPTQVFSLKGAYSHSFVDAASFYRSSTISIFSGGADLDPEKMDSYQVGASFRWKPLHLNYEVNAFCNNVTDMVYYSGSSTANSTTFENAGRICMGGVEQVLQYTTEKTLANLNFTYQYPMDVEKMSTSKHELYNVPHFLLNLTAQQQFLRGKRMGTFWVRAHVHAQSSFHCQETDIVKLMMASTKITHLQKAYATIGAGLEWESNFGLGASLDCYNLTNTRYEVGGQLYSGIPGQRTHLMGRVRMKF